jgi:hypothetical protein
VLCFSAIHTAAAIDANRIAHADPKGSLSALCNMNARLPLRDPLPFVPEDQTCIASRRRNQRTAFGPTAAPNTKSIASMWFRRTLSRLLLAKRPKFREINWQDDGEVRPVTRGKAKQFTGMDEFSPTTGWKGAAAPYRMRSNLSYSSQAPLNTSEGGWWKYDRRGGGRPRHFTALSRM